MSLKIKPPKPKRRRRGAHFITEYPNGETHILGRHPSGYWQPVEIISPHFHYNNILTSDCGTLAIVRGIARYDSIGWLPTQIVLAGDGAYGDRVAFRSEENEAWVFTDGSVGPDVPFEDLRLFIPAAQAGIKNVALLAAVMVGEMSAELAKFLGLSCPALCDFKKVAEMKESPRYAQLRDFAFRVTAAGARRAYGHRAENEFRHKSTNYDQMLQAAGGLLYPEQYEVVRKGVDAIVASNLRKEVA